MTSGVLHKKSDIINAIIEKKGIIRAAAKKLEINHKTIYDWIDRDPDVAKAVEESRQLVIRDQEDQDHDLVAEAYESIKYLLKTNDVTATIFTLKAKRKWAEHKKEHEIAMAQTQFQVVDYSKAVDG